MFPSFLRQSDLHHSLMSDLLGGVGSGKRVMGHREDMRKARTGDGQGIKAGTIESEEH